MTKPTAAEVMAQAEALARLHYPDAQVTVASVLPRDAVVLTLYFPAQDAHIGAAIVDEDGVKNLFDDAAHGLAQRALKSGAPDQHT